MPKRTNITKILIIGAGPIVIGQGCEFDYSGTQAVKALRAEGYTVILVNSNPTTIMTDPQLADRTYIEPLSVESLTRVILQERPDALLPTVGGQTALNLALELHKQGILARCGVELLGATIETILLAENREEFKSAMTAIGLETARSQNVKSLEEAVQAVKYTGFPAIIRPSFTLGGMGSGIAYTMQEFLQSVAEGLSLSPVHTVLIEESLLGWKEFELELMRDCTGNGLVVCSIENIDPMGVHTGDSITVAPIQTLSDREYQYLRNCGLRIMETVGMQTGGANVQFAVHPLTGRVIVVEMNPRVSRSSALASKATGFPIAKIAAKLAIGYTLVELPNDITHTTLASFEPALDYVVVKIPRWNFEKFPGAQCTLGTSMQSVGEVMAIGRTFAQALQKALRSLENVDKGLSASNSSIQPSDQLRPLLVTPTPDRLLAIFVALKTGWSVASIADMTGIDPWFLDQMNELLPLEAEIRRYTLADLPAHLLYEAKRNGYSDIQIADLLCNAEMALHPTENAVRLRRLFLNIKPTYHRVDTCAAEFPSDTPYLYSSYETECEAQPTERKKVLLLGSGPTRIGQGLEFDYSCCHAGFALRDLGFETIMVNCNPETVSTDYDTFSRLYFEPLTLEDVLNVIDVERPDGVLIQFGGQTPLKLANGLKMAGVPLWGTSTDAIDCAESRDQFNRLACQLNVRIPAYAVASSWEEIPPLALSIGYPLIVRPSYVLGGKGMTIVSSIDELDSYLRSMKGKIADHPILIDHFLENAVELDVDAVSDGTQVVIAGIMEQIEHAGVHSGDSACVMPTINISPANLEEISHTTLKIAQALGIKGLMNIQYALKDDQVYVLEVNPRASRSVPYVTKATGISWAGVAACVSTGVSLYEQKLIGPDEEIRCYSLHLDRYYVKEVTLPWHRLSQAIIALGPEMRSTGEAMGSGSTFGHAFANAQLGCGYVLPTSGAVFLHINRHNLPSWIALAEELTTAGFNLITSIEDALLLHLYGLDVKETCHMEDMTTVIPYVDLVIYASERYSPCLVAQKLYRAALHHNIVFITTLESALATIEAIKALQEGSQFLYTWQERTGTKHFASIAMQESIFLA